ncbi:MAG: tRNA (adenosine(37)-N6)-dimethylallyltransferase MiaA [Clostridia bacterium]|nr:tRNA (adenosine(37)-N6)-dimethylallyltransferase MiaA [Clostridia bacterium]
MQQIMVVAGPTASGKTNFAVCLAKKYGGEVVSADSIQIYQELNIASAKPTKEEMGDIPHHMLDMVSPFDRFSVADYVAKAKTAIDGILSHNALPIVAGGTGLYISSLVDNIEFLDSACDMGVREALLLRVETEGIMPLYEELKKIDPKAAMNIHPNNAKRVVRALEIFETTGMTLTEQNERSRQNPSPYEPFMIALCPPRELLYERIDQRVDQMVNMGLLEESKRLKDMGLSREMQSMQGIGYKEVFDYLEGKVTLDDCIANIKKATRHYAKRQLTWFRRDERYHWVNPMDEQAIESVLEEFTWERP